MAPDGGLPGIPGAGPSGGNGGLPGIPGSGSSGSPTPPAAPQAISSPSFSQPAEAVIGAPVTFELASWGRRFAALLLDGIVMGILFAVLLGVAAAAGLDLGSSSSGDGSFQFQSDGGEFVLVLLVWLIVTLIYAPVTMASMEGSTPGKRILGIRVVRADGAPLTFGFAVKREVLIKGVLLGAVNFVTLGLAFLLNYLWPLWDSENRAVHDIVAKSRVVRR